MAFLTGKTAIVSGAAQGLGKSFADTLAAEGANVTLFDKQAFVHLTAQSVARHGTGVHALTADVSVSEHCVRVVAETFARFGRVDILVNNAAVWKETPVEDTWENAIADFDAIMNVNLKGVMMMSRLCVPYMIEGGGGDIVNISTDYVLPVRREGLNPHDTDVYNASKWALNGLTDAAAKYLAGSHIRVNALAMGAVDTPLVRSLFAPGGKLHSVSANGEIPPALQALCMDPDEIARLLIDLLKDGRSGENIGIFSLQPIRLGPRKRADVKLRERADFTAQPLREFGPSAWSDEPAPVTR
jgi:NAD(P)-dependent dehydrogenase (short-subunit alcohol dehydrogenase family)